MKNNFTNENEPIIRSVILRGVDNLSRNEPLYGRKISNGEGVNNFEKSTLKIISEFFSNYMIFTNPFKNKGHELCDFMAVMNNDIFLISDKGTASFDNVNIDDEITIKKKWFNYYNSIKKSTSQLIDAKKWIIENIKEGKLTIFNKDSDSINDTVDFIFDESPNFYLINTLSGLSDFCIKYFKDSKSLVLDKTQKQGKDKTLSINLIQKNENEYVHTIDEQGLKDLNILVSTPTDFINYLKFRRKFISLFETIKIRKENHILYFYAKEILLNEKININNTTLIIKNNFESDKNDKLILSLYTNNFITDYVYWEKKSIIFNMLMVNFFYSGNYTNSGLNLNEPEDVDFRRGAYHLQSFSRKERIAISLDILDVLNEKSNKNIIRTKNIEGLIICIISFRMLKNERLDEYRLRRAKFSLNYFNNLCIRYKGKILVLAIDHKKNIPTNSEDLFCALI